jgi:hypothetical protein
VSALVDATTNDPAARGDEHAPTLIHTARAVLYIGLGRYDDALAATRLATSRPWAPDEPSVALVEAAARSGQCAEAAATLTRLAES